MPRVARLTRALVDAAEPAPPGGSYYLMDEELPGFGVRVYAAARVWIVRHRRRTVQIAPVPLLPIAAARREAAALLLELRSGSGPWLAGSGPWLAGSRPWTVADLWERVDREHYALRLAPQTRRNRRGYWEAQILPRLGALRVAEVRRDHVAAIMRELSDRPGAANEVLAALSHAFGLAELWDPAWRAPGSNPCRGVAKFPRYPRGRTLSETEYRRLWAALERAELEELVPLVGVELLRFLVVTGCRPGEAMGARWEHVELLERHGPDGAARVTARLVLPTAKGDRGGRRRGRVVWLSAPALEILRRLEPVPGSALLFPSPRTGGRVSTIKRWWGRVRELAGLGEDVVPYTLRHSYVTEGDAAAVPLAVMADLAGHARIATTDGVYRHGREVAQIAGAERMGEHLRGILEGAAGEELPPPSPLPRRA